jgi:hypothetical protein
LKEEQMKSVSASGAGEADWNREHPVWSGVLTVLVAVVAVAIVFVGVIWVMGD